MNKNGTNNNICNQNSLSTTKNNNKIFKFIKSEHSAAAERWFLLAFLIFIITNRFFFELPLSLVIHASWLSVDLPDDFACESLSTCLRGAHEQFEQVHERGWGLLGELASGSESREFVIDNDKDEADKDESLYSLVEILNHAVLRK